MCLSSYSHKKSCDFKKWHTESKKGDPLTKIVNKISGHINRSTVSIMWEVRVFCLALITLSLPRVLCILVTLQIGVRITLVNFTSLVFINGFVITLKIISKFISMAFLYLSPPHPLLPHSLTSLGDLETG